MSMATETGELSRRTGNLCVCVYLYGQHQKQDNETNQRPGIDERDSVDRGTDCEQRPRDETRQHIDSLEQTMSVVRIQIQHLHAAVSNMQTCLLIPRLYDRADIEQTSSWLVQLTYSSSSSQLDRVNGRLMPKYMRPFVQLPSSYTVKG